MEVRVGKAKIVEIICDLCASHIPSPGGISEYWGSGHRRWESQTDSWAHLEHHSPLAGMC